MFDSYSISLSEFMVLREPDLLRNQLGFCYVESRHQVFRLLHLHPDKANFFVENKIYGETSSWVRPFTNQSVGPQGQEGGRYRISYRA